jgi:hypothetical protein
MCVAAAMMGGGDLSNKRNRRCTASSEGTSAGDESWTWRELPSLEAAGATVACPIEAVHTNLRVESARREMRRLRLQAHAQLRERGCISKIRTELQ